MQEFVIIHMGILFGGIPSNELWVKRKWNFCTAWAWNLNAGRIFRGDTFMFQIGLLGIWETRLVFFAGLDPQDFLE